MTKAKFGILLVLLNVFLNKTLQAQVQDEQKIVSGERTIDAQFGSAVDIYMNYAVVGEPYNDTDDSLKNYLEDAGAAYILKKGPEGDWIRTQKLVAPDRVADGLFGFDVAIYDTTALIGSDKDKVYVFERNMDDIWIYKQTISETEGQEFGQHLSMHNNYAIIGDKYAWGIFSGGFKYPAGAAYIYEKDGTGIWIKKTKIMASDYATYDSFGESVDIFNDFAIVGNSRHNNNRGAAYVFKRSPAGVWGEVQKIEASSLELGDAFGRTVAIYDSVFGVGSIGENYDAEGSNYKAGAGAVYVYNINNIDSCVFSEKIVAPVRNTTWAYFGASLDLNNNYLIISAPKEEEDSNDENTLQDAGATYVYEKNGFGKWSFNLKLTPADRAPTDLFGHDVALYMENFIVGSPQGDLDSISLDSIGNAGCSYIYKLQTVPGISVQPINQNDICSGSEIVFSVVGSRIENYQWQVSPDAGTTWANITDDTIYSGTDTDSLIINTNTELNNNQYFCSVSNGFGNLNSDTVVLTITVDSEAPSITSVHNNLVVDADTNCKAILSDYTSDITAIDNCDAAPEVTQSPIAGTKISGNTNTVILTVTDNAGNTNEVSFNVSVEDNTNPVISSNHSDQTIDASANCEVSLPDYTSDIIATDNCDADLEINQNPIAGTSISGNTNTVTLTVSDDAGNTSEVAFNVSVEDNTNPVISSNHIDQTIDANANCEANLPDYTSDIIATDNCDTDLDINQNPVAGTSISGNINTVTLVVSDDAGNASEIAFNVSVEDNTKPAVTCPENKTIILNAGQSTYTVSGTELDPIVNDNCGIADILNNFNKLSSLSGAVIPVGKTSIIWTVSDNGGNDSVCTFDITVNEKTTSILSMEQNGISIFPNPTKGIVNLECEGNNVQSVKISDTTGKNVFEKNRIHKQESIDISKLKNGIYIISIQTIDGVITTKIIKE